MVQGKRWFESSFDISVTQKPSFLWLYHWKVCTTVLTLITIVTSVPFLYALQRLNICSWTLSEWTEMTVCRSDHKENWRGCSFKTKKNTGDCCYASSDGLEPWSMTYDPTRDLFIFGAISKLLICQKWKLRWALVFRIIKLIVWRYWCPCLCLWLWSFTLFFMGALGRLIQHLAQIKLSMGLSKLWHPMMWVNFK